MDAKPKAEVAWTKNGESIVTNDKFLVETLADGACRLTINSFTKEDAAHYHCIATNQLGTAKTKANLQVEGKPAMI